MNSKFRIRESKARYTPQRRILWMWFNIARPQPTMERARAIVRAKLQGSKAAENAEKPA